MVHAKKKQEKRTFIKIFIICTKQSNNFLFRHTSISHPLAHFNYYLPVRKDVDDAIGQHDGEIPSFVFVGCRGVGGGEEGGPVMAAALVMTLGQSFPWQRQTHPRKG